MTQMESSVTHIELCDPKSYPVTQIESCDSISQYPQLSSSSPRPPLSHRTGLQGVRDSAAMSVKKMFATRLWSV